MDPVSLHLLALIITVPAILYGDHLGIAYFSGRVGTISRQKIVWTHRAVMIGLLLLITTGIATMLPMWAVMLEKPLFYAKLACVATLLVNSFFISGLMLKATAVPYASLLPHEQRVLLVSGGVSGCCWITAILIGLFGL